MKRFAEQRCPGDEQPNNYFRKTFHLVLNRYDFRKNHGLDQHQDKARTYHSKNPITSFSFGCGSLLVITDSLKANKRTAVYYQFPGDAIVMSGPFNDRFFHGVPSLNAWSSLLYGAVRGEREVP